MTVLDELGAYMATEGVGTVGVDIFKGLMPDKPPACVALIETGGLAAEYKFGSATIDYETPSIQVIARAADYEAARTKAEAAITALAKIQAQDLTGVFYHHVTPQQSPFFLGLDDTQRPRVVFNVLAQKDPS